MIKFSDFQIRLLRSSVDSLYSIRESMSRASKASIEAWECASFGSTADSFFDYFSTQLRDIYREVYDLYKLGLIALGDLPDDEFRLGDFYRYPSEVDDDD